MKVKDYYQDALTDQHYSMRLLIEYLVHEKKVLTMDDSEEKLSYYLQERFTNKLNQYLSEYERGAQNVG
ncbi:hypothetical protein [Metabacillus sp. 84]|uniref:hypothetical protein n=1 Tax=Metabacillus sp. 84 TaxID=3404705 RepID=UPI003CE8B6F4